MASSAAVNSASTPVVEPGELARHAEARPLQRAGVERRGEVGAGVGGSRLRRRVARVGAG
jgi:hypothetical protein